MGLANQISLGQGAFMLIGGYAAAILTATHHWNLALAAVAAVAVAAAGAAVIGGLALRLTGFNLAIATLGIHLILLVMVTQWAFTGETLGVTGIPPFQIFGIDMFSSFRFYYVGLVCLAGLSLDRPQPVALAPRPKPASARRRRTRRAQPRCACVQVEAGGVRHRGAMGGLSGVLWAYFVRFAAPSTWDVGLTIDLVTYTIVGGLLSVYGGAVGAAAVSALLYLVATSDVGGSSQGEVEIVLSGVLLVVFVLLFRDGLVAAFRRAAAAIIGAVRGARSEVAVEGSPARRAGGRGAERAT